MTVVRSGAGDERFPTSREVPLVDLLDRLLDKGAALGGDLVVSVAGVDLVHLGLRAVLQGIDGPEAGDMRASSTSTAHDAPAGPHAVNPRHGPSVRSSPALHAPPHPHALVQTPPSEPRAASQEPRGAPISRLEPRRRDERVALDADDVERGLVQLVLTLVELLREVLERQALRRVETTSLGDADVERLGRAFLELEARMADLKSQFGLSDDDVRLGMGVIRDVG